MSDYLKCERKEEAPAADCYRGFIFLKGGWYLIKRSLTLRFRHEFIAILPWVQRVSPVFAKGLY